jgi:hypothetical protein
MRSRRTIIQDLNADISDKANNLQQQNYFVSLVLVELLLDVRELLSDRLGHAHSTANGSSQTRNTNGMASRSPSMRL